MQMFLPSVLFLAMISCVSLDKEKIRTAELTSTQLLLTRNLLFYQYYDEAIEMFTYIRDQNTENIAIKVEAEYEIAFSYWKKRDLQNAKKNFEVLISFYDNYDLEQEIPKWPYFLSKKVLEEKVLPALQGQVKKPSKNEKP